MVGYYFDRGYAAKKWLNLPDACASLKLFRKIEQERIEEMQ